MCSLVLLVFFSMHKIHFIKYEFLNRSSTFWIRFFFNFSLAMNLMTHFKWILFVLEMQPLLAAAIKYHVMVNATHCRFGATEFSNVQMVWMKKIAEDPVKNSQLNLHPVAAHKLLQWYTYFFNHQLIAVAQCNLIICIFSGFADLSRVQVSWWRSLLLNGR